ncbi:MAG TPA: DUF2182 domain-containing protein, partial [Propionicimonas sp.]|nr:DUF2182 domain-containing protein [Propionicimonas sp.]
MSSTGAVRTLAASRRLWSGAQPLLAWWPVLVLSGGSLVVMLAWGGMGVAALEGSAPAHASHAGLLVLLPWWGCMTVGMMLPSTLPAMARIRQVVPRPTRPVALSLFALVFVAAWLPGAVLAEPLMGLSARPIAGVLAMTAAGLWELTPAKRRALLECRRFPVISAQQPRGHRDVARFGVRRAGT